MVSFSVQRLLGQEQQKLGPVRVSSMARLERPHEAGTRLARASPTNHNKALPPAQHAAVAAAGPGAPQPFGAFRSLFGNSRKGHMQPVKADSCGQLTPAASCSSGIMPSLPSGNLLTPDGDFTASEVTAREIAPSEITPSPQSRTASQTVKPLSPPHDISDCKGIVRSAFTRPAHGWQAEPCSVPGGASASATPLVMPHPCSSQGVSHPCSSQGGCDQASGVGGEGLNLKRAGMGPRRGSDCRAEEEEEEVGRGTSASGAACEDWVEEEVVLQRGLRCVS